ncbi:acyltransferase family protein [Rhizobacter sp. OV335]|uniref:acyltransferase family protein n=1 Tax=Rhizobacter sp. OV335 TaxID=1500264 RepID=UPI000918BB13|nr:acyltransferase [Rhizobacter sp. OV335]SHN29786.1 acyltransferase [Rhizobacter sp. OV335]
MDSGFATPRGTQRLPWVDTAKAVGIVLMFYGHVVQSRAGGDNASAVDQLRLIYAFHMPLFFVLAGLFFHPVAALLPRLRTLAQLRLVPVLFFGLLLLPLWSLSAVKHHFAWWYYAQPLGAAYLRGMPELNWVTWFLVCMVVCEAMALVVLPRLRLVAARLAFAAACIVGGVFLCNHGDALEGWVAQVSRIWFVREAIVALGFYTIGQVLRPFLQQLATHRGIALSVTLACTSALLATYRLNHPHDAQAVMMAAAQHGDALGFAFSALAGTLAVIGLAMLLPATRVAAWIGRNSLPLMGLNGVFFHFFNPKLAESIALADTPLAVTAYAAAISAVSLLACVPLVALLNRFVPQFIGKARPPAAAGTETGPAEGASPAA